MMATCKIKHFCNCFANVLLYICNHRLWSPVCFLFVIFHIVILNILLWRCMISMGVLAMTSDLYITKRLRVQLMVVAL